MCNYPHSKTSNHLCDKHVNRSKEACVDLHVADYEHAYGAENTFYASAEGKQSDNLLCLMS